MDLRLWGLRERIYKRIKALEHEKEKLAWHNVYGPPMMMVVNPLKELRWVMADLELILQMETVDDV